MVSPGASEKAKKQRGVEQQRSLDDLQRMVEMSIDAASMSARDLDPLDEDQGSSASVGSAAGGLMEFDGPNNRGGHAGLAPSGFNSGRRNQHQGKQQPPSSTSQNCRAKKTEASAAEQVPRWWLELKATVSGAASAAAAGGSGGGGRGVVLGHRRLRDWAGQLYGGGKMDEDALRAAVAWMEERGVLSQLTMGEAQFHGVGDAGGGPYYRLHGEPEKAAVSPLQVLAAAVNNGGRLGTGPGAPPAAPNYGAAAAAAAAAAAVVGMPPSPRYSGASAVERAERSAAQQLLRERHLSARKSEARSLDRALDAVYGQVSKQSARWEKQGGMTFGFR